MCNHCATHCGMQEVVSNEKYQNEITKLKKKQEELEAQVVNISGGVEEEHALVSGLVYNI